MVCLIFLELNWKIPSGYLKYFYKFYEFSNPFPSLFVIFFFFVFYILNNLFVQYNLF